MLKFDFLKKNPGIVSPTYFLHYFWRKIFLLLYSINRSNFNVWLSLLCEILDNMCIAVVCWQGCNVINFEIFFSLFSTWSKSQDKKSFQGEKKGFFIIFKRAFSWQKLSQTLSVPFRCWQNTYKEVYFFKCGYICLRAKLKIYQYQTFLIFEKKDFFQLFTVLYPSESSSVYKDQARNTNPFRVTGLFLYPLNTSISRLSRFLVFNPSKLFIFILPFEAPLKSVKIKI